MKLILYLCLVAVAAAAPAQSTRYTDPDDVLIIRYENNNDGDGSYQYGYEQSDGTRQDQRGVIKNQGREDEFLAVQGTFSWIAPNGIRYTVTYTADEEGYKPELEEGPGVPPHVLASALGAG